MCLFFFGLNIVMLIKCLSLRDVWKYFNIVDIKFEIKNVWNLKDNSNKYSYMIHVFIKSIFKITLKYEVYVLLFFI